MAHPNPLSLMRPVRSSASPAPRAIVAPTELGEPMDAEEIRREFFKDRVSREWVLDNVAPAQKWYMGRLAVWYRGHVEAWMPTHVATQQARAQRRKKAVEQ